MLARTATGEAREVINKIAIREWARLNFGGKIYRYNYYYVYTGCACYVGI